MEKIYFTTAPMLVRARALPVLLGSLLLASPQQAEAEPDDTSTPQAQQGGSSQQDPTAQPHATSFHVPVSSTSAHRRQNNRNNRE